MVKFYCLIFFLFLFLNEKTFSQVKIDKAELSLSSFLDPYHFTKDSLVLINNRGKNSLADEQNIELLLSFKSDKIKRIEFIAGAGLSTRHFAMRKFRLENFLVFVFPFSTARDTFYLSKVKYSGNYFNLPLGFSYQLTNKDYRRVQFFAGVNLVSSFKTTANIDVQPDSNYFIPSLQKLQQVKDLYLNQLRNYIIRFSPFLDMHVRVINGVGIKVGYSLFNFYPISWSKSITKGYTAWGINMSLFYKPKSKKN